MLDKIKKEKEEFEGFIVSNIIFNLIFNFKDS